MFRVINFNQLYQTYNQQMLYVIPLKYPLAHQVFICAENLWPKMQKVLDEVYLDIYDLQSFSMRKTNFLYYVADGIVSKLYVIFQTLRRTSTCKVQFQYSPSYFKDFFLTTELCVFQQLLQPHQFIFMLTANQRFRRKALPFQIAVSLQLQKL